MGSASGFRPFGLLAGAVVVALLALTAWIGPVAAFHFLPYSITKEDAKLASALELGPGSVVADIGAGRGALSVALAARIAPGRMYASELTAARRDRIRARARRLGARNLTVVEAAETETGLPDACCDAIVLRNVYHHIGNPARFNQSLARALRSGGRLAIIDFPPNAFSLLRTRPEGTFEKRVGHGVDPKTVRQELEPAGFTFEREDDDWGGRLFLLVLKKAPGQIH